jgi:hypothetical protein
MFCAEIMETRRHARMGDCQIAISGGEMGFKSHSFTRVGCGQGRQIRTQVAYSTLHALTISRPASNFGAKMKDKLRAAYSLIVQVKV